VGLGCVKTRRRREPIEWTFELWLHEIKHDGFRVIARKDGTRNFAVRVLAVSKQPDAAQALANSCRRPMPRPLPLIRKSGMEPPR
jgi:hypothetical protein